MNKPSRFMGFKHLEGGVNNSNWVNRFDIVANYMQLTSVQIVWKIASYAQY